MYRKLRSIFRKYLKKSRKRKRAYQINYHEKWLLPPLALFVGIYIVLYAHHRSFGKAVLMVDFYKAALPSVLAAWLMMRYIVARTYRLDNRYPWAIGWWCAPLPRLVLQVWHGIIVPGFFVLIFYAFYFTVRGHPLRFWRYANEDFYFVLLMLLGFNVLIWAYYRLRTIEIMHKFRQWQRQYGKTAAEMEARWALGSVDVVPDTERASERIALIEPCKDGKGTCWSTDFAGNVDKEPYTMKAFYKKNEGDHFFKARYAVIVNRVAISEVEDDAGDVIIILAKGRPGDRITVSVRRREKFLRWFTRDLRP